MALFKSRNDEQKLPLALTLESLISNGVPEQDANIFLAGIKEDPNGLDVRPMTKTELDIAYGVYMYARFKHYGDSTHLALVLVNHPMLYLQGLQVLRNILDRRSGGEYHGKIDKALQAYALQLEKDASKIV
jgi:hypothetical protein